MFFRCTSRCTRPFLCNAQPEACHNDVILGPTQKRFTEPWEQADEDDDEEVEMSSFDQRNSRYILPYVTRRFSSSTLVQGILLIGIGGNHDLCLLFAILPVQLILLQSPFHHRGCRNCGNKDRCKDEATLRQVVHLSHSTHHQHNSQPNRLSSRVSSSFPLFGAPNIELLGMEAVVVVVVLLLSSRRSVYFDCLKW